MTTWATTSVLTLALLQSAWGLTGAPPREVRRLYWELIPETEVWVRLVPEDPGGKPLVHLVFHAFYPGRAERDSYSGLPAWPKGAPKRLTVSAEPVPGAPVRDLSLRLVIDGRTIDLTEPNRRYRSIPCQIATQDCSPNGVEAELEAATVQAIAAARSIGGQALGLPITLVADDQRALREFVTTIGLSEGPRPH